MKRDLSWDWPMPGHAYGVYFCADGREVLFDRGYKPLLERRGGIVTPANPDEWVRDITRHAFLYNTKTQCPSRCKEIRPVILAAEEAFRSGLSMERFLFWSLGESPEKFAQGAQMSAA